MTILSNILLFVAIGFIALVSGHSYMTSPTSRSNQAQTQTGCRGPECLGPCDIPLARATRAPIAASRGDSFTVDWPRNNHAGGFIRFAWALTSESDNHAAFDNHVAQINCHEVGNPTPGLCAPSDPVNDPNGGGSGPADGSYGACNTNITVPLDLTDGKWTLQWAWFGGAFSLGDYYSCTDYIISGGPVGTLTPVFKGGDFSYPNQQVCKFFNTDKLHVCVDEPCQNPLFPLAQAQVGPPADGQLGNFTSSSTPSSPVTTGLQLPVTTGIQLPVTTGVKLPSTTGSNLPITTSKIIPIAPVTTGSDLPSTTSKPIALTTGSVQPITTGSIPPITTGSDLPLTTSEPIPLTTGSVPLPITSGSITSGSITSGSITSGSIQMTTGSDVSNPIDNCAGASSISSSSAAITYIDSWSNEVHLLIEIYVDEDVLHDWVLEITFPTATQILSSFNAGVLQCFGTDTAYYKPIAPWSNNVPHGSVIQVEFIATNNELLTQDFIKANTGLVVLKH